LKIEQELGNRSGIASSLHNLGVLAQDQGDYTAARTYYEQSLKIKQELGNRSGIASSLGQLGRLAYLEKDYVTAVRCWVVAQSIFEKLGAPERAIALRDLAGLREELGEEAFNAVLAEALKE
jgi:tetratricopeptide (TPR) repeat protein